MQQDSIKILYILGYERCGSTVLHRVLGEIDGFLAVGEIRHLWRNLIENRQCGSGVPLQESEFWKQVLNQAFGGIDQIDLKEMARLGYEVTVPDYLFSLLPQGQPALNDRLKIYLPNLEKLYQAIQSVSGCSIIVDSSKMPIYGCILKMLPSVELYFIHLVRDPRGIGYSLLRRKKDGHPQYKHYNPVKGSFTWMKRCLTTEALFQSPAERYLMLRYEDFVEQPQKTVEHILEFVQEKAKTLPFLEDGKVELHPSPSAGGSPSRFESGAIELRPDDQWKQKLKPTEKAIFTSLTWPLLVRYGYSSWVN